MRWNYAIEYRRRKSKNYPDCIELCRGTMEELDEIYEIIEAGPSWQTVIKIEIKLIEKSKLTVEGSLEL